MNSKYSVNERAIDLLQRQVLPFAEHLQIEVHKMPCGCTLVDMGVLVDNGWRAAKLFTEVSLAGLGSVHYIKRKLGSLYMPAVMLTVDEPVIAEMSSHVAYWRVPYKGTTYNLSGPVRAKVLDAFSRKADYQDLQTERVLAAFQTDSLPDDDFCRLLAETAGVKPENFYLMVARTGTLLGLIQVAARNVEQVLPTLADQGFDLDFVRYATGVSPLVHVTDDEMEAYGRVNDCLIYGQETTLYVDCDDSEITSMLGKITMDQAGNHEVYGMPFSEIFSKCESDWCKVPRAWDAPAMVRFFNLRSGKHFVAGRQEEDILVRDIWGKQGGRV